MTFGRAAIAVAVLALLAALLVPYENPSGDATGHGVTIRDGGPTRVNPNRLLLEPAVYGIHAVASRFAPVEPLGTLLWIARLTLVGYALLMFRIASLLFRSAAVSFAISAGCIASYSCLYFGTDGEPILLAHLPLLLGGALHLRAWQRSSTSLHALAGIAYAISILAYISNIIPVGVFVLASLIGFARRRTGQALIIPAVVSLAAGIGLVVAHAWSESPLSIHRWILAYGGGTANLSYGGFSAISLLRVVFGLGSGLVGAGGAARLVRRWTEGEESIEPLPGATVELAVWGLALTAAAVLTVLAAGRIRRIGGLARAVLVTCLASSALLTVFNFLWIGSDPQFWVPVVPLLWIVWGFAVERSRRGALLVATIVVGFLLPYNVFLSVRPLRGDTEPKLRRMELMSHTPEPCLIVTPGIDWVDSYARYYPMGNRTVLSLWRLSTDPVHSGDLGGYLATVESAIDATLAAGHPVFVRGVIEERFPGGIPWREMEPRGFRLDRIQVVVGRYSRERAFTIRGNDYWRIVAPE